MDGRGPPPLSPAHANQGWTVVESRHQSRWERKRKKLPPIFDSGATRSMTPERADFIGPITPHRGVVHLGDDSTIASIASGRSTLGDSTLLVPSLARPLISTAGGR